jgi:hypothetical protein
MRVSRKNIIARLDDRVARQPAGGIVPLRRHVGQCAGLERTGYSVIVENGPAPSAAAGVRDQLPTGARTMTRLG